MPHFAFCSSIRVRLIWALNTKSSAVTRVGGGPYDLYPKASVRLSIAKESDFPE